MADPEPARAQSTDEVKSHLDEGLKSCTKLLASYREALTRKRHPTGDGWKR
jgi:hypothetical protein